MGRTLKQLFALLLVQGSCAPFAWAASVGPLGQGTAVNSITGADPAIYERQANRSLGQELLKMLRDPELALRYYGAADTNNNDGNFFSSNITYHSYVWDYCLNWVTPILCEKWLPAYTPLHGLTDEQSNLEGSQGKIFQKTAQSTLDTLKKAGQSSGDFGIFEVQAKQGKSIVRGFESAKAGSLAMENLADIRLIDEAKKSAEQIGSQNGERIINGMGSAGKEMESPEKMRLAASVLTRAMRNRMVANIGEIRAAAEGTEFEVGEDRTCSDFLEIAKGSVENGLPAPGTVNDLLRSPVTRSQSLQKRFETCVALMNTPVNVVNARGLAGKVEAGDPDEERVDEWKSRVNIAVIDRAGLDPNSVPKPGYGEIRQEDYTNVATDYREGGKEAYQYSSTNAQDIDQYNQKLEESAASFEQAKAISGGKINISSGDVTKYKIPKERVDLISLNGLTPGMMKDLKDSPIAGTPLYNQGYGQTSGSSAPVQLEAAPSALTVTPLGQ